MKTDFLNVLKLFRSYSFLLKESDRTVLGQGFGLSENNLL